MAEFSTTMGKQHGIDELNVRFRSGWNSINDNVTAEYVAPNQIKIVGLDWRDRIQKGTKIRYKQGGDWKYDFVSDISYSTDTTLTLMGGSTVEDLPIIDFAYSNIANPIGWPFGVDYIEGSNDNGTWKKWVDGTKECEGKIVLNDIDVSTASGSVYRSDVFKTTWPCEFSSPPKAYYEMNPSGGGLFWLSVGNSNISTIESNDLYIVCSTSETERSFEIVFRVKGE